MRSRVIIMISCAIGVGITPVCGSVSTGFQQTPAHTPAYRVDTILGGLRAPWSMAFLPDQEGMLISEKYGTILLRSPDSDSTVSITGGPQDVYQRGDSGLLDILLDPDFAENRRVYVAFSEGTDHANRTALFRGRFVGTRLLDGEVIFRATPDKAGAGHPGGRMLVLPDRTLLLTIGEGYEYADHAQSLRSHLGKIVRLHLDGSIPTGNPFLRDPSALPELFTFGHRNAQGIIYDPREDRIWSHEHGPKGGDEINLIQAGMNFGWPTTTFGIDYDDTIISQLREAPGIEAPRVIWIPSIAPSGFTLYLGDRFPAWRGDFFVGALAGRHLRRVRIRDGEAVLQEVLLDELNARIRDVRTGPDGNLYLLTDHATDARLLRLRPH